MQITMIGHSTVLFETQGKRILTDPFFSKRGNLAYKRTAPPARGREELADVDLVLLSHGHFDHIDGPFLRALPPSTPILTTRRLPLARARFGPGVIPVGDWEQHTFGPLAITAVPAVHAAPTNGFVIASEGLHIYFAADTYFHGFMHKLRERFRLDVALMPVTTFRIPMTMGERQAVRAVELLQPRVVIPIHLGIQPRSPLLRTRQSPEGFAQRLEQAGSPAQVVVLREGGTWHSDALAA